MYLLLFLNNLYETIMKTQVWKDELADKAGYKWQFLRLDLYIVQFLTDSEQIVLYSMTDVIITNVVVQDFGRCSLYSAHKPHANQFDNHGTFISATLLVCLYPSTSWLNIKKQSIYLYF